ncbi:MAG TPA: DNA gyrase inhibitor YacG [Azospirillum sp.]|nr:DNA gyrase inhibitor YacG [Azospirillum sp.]
MTERGSGSVACPICGKPAAAEYRPFCSKRCADVDLSRWLGGVYRVETEEGPDDPKKDEE